MMLQVRVFNVIVFFEIVDFESLMVMCDVFVDVFIEINEIESFMCDEMFVEGFLSVVGVVVFEGLKGVLIVVDLCFFEFFDCVCDYCVWLQQVYGLFGGSVYLFYENVMFVLLLLFFVECLQWVDCLWFVFEFEMWIVLLVGESSVEFFGF